ncbi:RNA-directed DNA polymerase from mobile element jockey [Trichonephila clavata]|uniref:RNA-directed DNA polymerase from mobile element jockey n=1 Tax=Trichonephila clavata TaxID=2740835 RepID=A0A8X6GVX8_TRICU|nr:RNA-directed DNA polymerase from mobile element jockey [Trichonephila clavata]
MLYELPYCHQVGQMSPTWTYKPSNLFWSFKRANWTSFEKILSEQLLNNPITEDLENEWTFFKHSIFRAEIASIPRGKHKKRKPTLIHDSEILQKLLSQREQLLKSHNLNDNTDARIELNKLNTEIKREYRTIKSNNWQDLCRSLDCKTPNTRLWKLAKNLDKIQPQQEHTNSIVDANGSPTVNDQETAEALGHYYADESKLDWSNALDMLWQDILSKLAALTQVSSVCFQWIPSHVGVYRNEVADLLAQEDSELPTASSSELQASKVNSCSRARSKLFGGRCLNMPGVPLSVRDCPCSAPVLD